MRTADLLATVALMSMPSAFAAPMPRPKPEPIVVLPEDSPYRGTAIPLGRRAVASDLTKEDGTVDLNKAHVRSAGSPSIIAGDVLRDEADNLFAADSTTAATRSRPRKVYSRSRQLPLQHGRGALPLARDGRPFAATRLALFSRRTVVVVVWCGRHGGAGLGPRRQTSTRQDLWRIRDPPPRRPPRRVSPAVVERVFRESPRAETSRRAQSQSHPESEMDRIGQDGQRRSDQLRRGDHLLRFAQDWLFSSKLLRQHRHRVRPIGSLHQEVLAPC